MGGFTQIFVVFFLTKMMGMDTLTAGFYSSLLGVSSLLGNSAVGKVGDSYGRKVLMVGSMMMAASFLFVCGFLERTMIIPYLLIVSNFFMGAVRPLIRSIVADLTEGETRQRAFSLMYLATNIGVAIGPAIAGHFFESHIEWIFIGEGLALAVSALLIFLYVPESKPTAEEIQESLQFGSGQEQASQESMWKLLLQRPYILFFTILVFFSNLVYTQHAFSLPLYLEELFPKEGAAYFGHLMSFNAIVVLVCTSVLHHLTGKNKPVNNVAIASLMYGVGFGMLIFPMGFTLLGVSTFLWTIGEIMLITNFNVYIAAHTPMTHRNRFNSFVQSITGSGFMLGPIISGWFLEEYSLDLIWYGAFFLSVLVALGMVWVDRYEHKVIEAK